MESLKESLMKRDGITAEEADDFIAAMKEEVLRGADPEEVLHDHAGLEPDFIFDIM